MDIMEKGIGNYTMRQAKKSDENKEDAEGMFDE